MIYTHANKQEREEVSLRVIRKSKRWSLTQHLPSSHSFQIVAREARQRCTLYPLIGREKGCTAVVIITGLLDDRDFISKRQSVCLLFKITKCIGYFEDYVIQSSVYSFCKKCLSSLGIGVTSTDDLVERNLAKDGSNRLSSYIETG